MGYVAKEKTYKNSIKNKATSIRGCFFVIKIKIIQKLIKFEVYVTIFEKLIRNRCLY